LGREDGIIEPSQHLLRAALWRASVSAAAALPAGSSLPHGGAALRAVHCAAVSGLLLGYGHSWAQRWLISTPVGA